MANSTFKQTVDRVLTMGGQVTIGNSSGDFNSDTLDKPQQQAKSFVEYANRFLALETKGRFTKRKFQLTTAATTATNPNVYPISRQTRFERLVKDSWFLVSPTLNAQPLFWKKYDTWLTQYPQGETATGVPQFWIPLPPELFGYTELGGPATGTITGVTIGVNPVLTVVTNSRSAGDIIYISDIVGTVGTNTANGLNSKYWRVLAVSGLTITIEANTTGLVYTSGGVFEARDVDRISFSQPPNGAYVIQYEGYLNTVALVNETDQIIWPPEFEHLLWTAGLALFEVALSEGKAPNYQQMLEPAVTQVKQLSMGEVEDMPAIDLGLSVTNQRRGGLFAWNNNG